MEQRPPFPTATHAAVEERASQEAESMVDGCFREQHWKALEALEAMRSTLEDAAVVLLGRARESECA